MRTTDSSMLDVAASPPSETSGRRALKVPPLLGLGVAAVLSSSLWVLIGAGVANLLH